MLERRDRIHQVVVPSVGGVGMGFVTRQKVKKACKVALTGGGSLGDEILCKSFCRMKDFDWGRPTNDRER